jgi:hypothetical protein
LPITRRLVPHRHPHGLGLVELGVLEGRQPDQAIGQRLGQFALLEIDQVCQCHGQGPGHRARQLHRGGRLALPRRGQVLIVDEGHVKGVNAAGSTQDGRLDIVRLHGLDGREECPLVAVRAQIDINEDAAAVLARVLLQRQGDQVAEPAASCPDWETGGRRTPV